MFLSCHVLTEELCDGCRSLTLAYLRTFDSKIDASLRHGHGGSKPAVTAESNLLPSTAEKEVRTVDLVQDKKDNSKAKATAKSDTPSVQQGTARSSISSAESDKLSMIKDQVCRSMYSSSMRSVTFVLCLGNGHLDTRLHSRR